MDTDQTLTAGNDSTCKPYPRKCSECGAEIMAGRKSGRVLCPECRYKSKKAACKKYRSSEEGREKSRLACKKWREKYPEKTFEHNKAYREEHRDEMRAMRKAYYWKNLDRERERARLRAAAYRNKPGAKLELAKAKGTVDFCPRMRVRMLNLPCGDRPECWAGKPCEHCKGKARPKNYSYSWMGF